MDRKSNKSNKSVNGWISLLITELHEKMQ